MKFAYCITDGQNYEASDFASRPSEWISAHRTELECPLCHNLAFFRKASRSGQAACFGARPHDTACDLAVPPSDHAERAVKVDADVLTNKGRNFELRLPSRKRAMKSVLATNQTTDLGRIGAQFVKWRKNNETSSSINAKECLINLVLSENYRESDQTIRPPHGTRMQIKDFFVPLRQADTASSDIRGYWGSLYDYRELEDGTVWLNAGKRTHMSVLMNPGTLTELLASYGLEGVEDLIGVYVLVIGQLQVSRNSKLFLKPRDSRHVVLYMPDEAIE